MGNEVRRCVIISAAPNSDLSFFKSELSDDDFVICADGGYIYAQRFGIKPQLIVGDFDSSTMPDTDVPTIALPTEKDDTDTIYAIKQGISRGYDDFVLLAASGGREDHSYANYSALLYLKHRKCTGKILTKNSKVFILENEETELLGLNGKSFSIFPFAGSSCVVTLEGFYYPLSDYNLSADFPLGVSNIIISDSARVSVKKSAAIIYIANREVNDTN